MKKLIAVASVLSIIHVAPGLGAYAAWAGVVTSAAVRVAPVSGNLGLSAGGLGAGSRAGGPGLRAGAAFRGGTLNAFKPGGTLFLPRGISPNPAAAKSAAAVSVDLRIVPGGVSSVGPLIGSQAIRSSSDESAAPTSRAAAAAREVRPNARGTLSVMESRLREVPGAGLSAVSGKVNQDRVWAKSGEHDDVVGDPVEGAPAVSTKNSRLKPAPAGNKGGKWRPFVAVPLIVGALAAGKAVLGKASEFQTLSTWMDTISAIFAGLPAWAQTGVQVGGAFAIAAVAPKIVRAGFKFIFSWVEMDPLRESYIASVASTAAWFGATAYAVLALGGAFSLTLNLGVFAAATALASQDLAKNLATGFKLYRSERMRIGHKVEVWEEKGRVEEFNPRFTIINTENNPDVDYERVMIPNDKLSDKIISDWTRGGGTRLAAFSLIGLIPAALMGPLTFAAQVGGGALLSLYIADIFNQKSRRWEAKAREALAKDDLATYEAYAKRAKLLGWIRNGVYFAGLWFILGMFGVPASWASFGMTLFSAAVGFYSKSVATDLVGGHMIAYWRPFTVGDYIQTAGTKGWVTDIDESFLYIKKDAPDGPTDAIPLEKLLNEKIKIGRK